MKRIAIPILIAALIGGVMHMASAQTISCGGMFGFGGMIQTPCPGGSGPPPTCSGVIDLSTGCVQPMGATP